MIECPSQFLQKATGRPFCSSFLWPKAGRGVGPLLGGTPRAM